MSDLGRGKRVLVTGVTGWVAGPVATALAAGGAEVHGAARFGDKAARERLEAAGVTTLVLDLAGDDMSAVPADLDFVLNFAISKSNVFDEAAQVNAEGAAELMAAAAERSDRLAGFLHCSSTGVYEPNGHELLAETDTLGDSHKALGMTTYSISKIAGEVLVRYQCRRLGLPTVVARLNVPYGPTYGWPLFHVMMMERGMPIPVHVDGPTAYNPIHADDIVASLPYLLDMASVPATVANWGGEAIVSIEEWSEYLGELAGLTPTFAPTAKTLPSVIGDPSKLRAAGFRPSVDWREGFRDMLATSRPDLVRSAPA